MGLANSWEEKGRAEGRVEGEVRGRLDVARNMLLSGMDIYTVAKMTDLGRDKVEELKKQLKH